MKLTPTELIKQHLSDVITVIELDWYEEGRGFYDGMHFDNCNDGFEEHRNTPQLLASLRTILNRL